MLDMTYEEFKQKMDNDDAFLNLIDKELRQNGLKTKYINFIGKYLKEKNNK